MYLVKIRPSKLWLDPIPGDNDLMNRESTSPKDASTEVQVLANWFLREFFFVYS